MFIRDAESLFSLMNALLYSLKEKLLYTFKHIYVMRLTLCSLHMRRLLKLHTAMTLPAFRKAARYSSDVAKNAVSDIGSLGAGCISSTATDTVYLVATDWSAYKRNLAPGIRFRI